MTSTIDRKSYIKINNKNINRKNFMHYDKIIYNINQRLKNMNNFKTTLNHLIIIVKRVGFTIVVIIFMLTELLILLGFFRL